MATSISVPSGQSYQHDSTGRRLIFNGESLATSTKSAQKTNTKVNRRRLSPLVMIPSVLSVALMAVFFIWNKIEVNRLTSELNSMQVEYQNIVGKNELLRAEVNQKSTPARIEKIAADQLGLIYRKEQPVLFELETK